MISTGKTISDLLTASIALTALVGPKIYPIVAPEGTPGTFVLFERAFNNQFTKDGPTNSDSTITIKVVSEVYQAGIDAATAVYNALKAEARLLSGEESYSEGAYIQTLVLQFWSTV